MTTSRDFTDTIAAMAGFGVAWWQPGDEPTFAVPALGEPAALAQPVCMLKWPRAI